MKQTDINNICDSGYMIFCFDLDGTITKLNFTKNISDIKPNMEVVLRIRYLFKKGHIIIINTARFKHMSYITKKWLNKYNIPYHEIYFNKPIAHIYIDDSTVDIKKYMNNPEYFEKKFCKIGNAINKQCRIIK